MLLSLLPLDAQLVLLCRSLLLCVGWIMIPAEVVKRLNKLKRVVNVCYLGTIFSK